jgi:hypothetical protein
VKTIQDGVISKDITPFKVNEEVYIVASIKGSQFESGQGYIIVSPLPPYTSICVDSSFVKGESEDLMELGQFTYPLYKGLFVGAKKEQNVISFLETNSEVYVLASIQSFIFQNEKGYIVANKKMIDSEHFMFYHGSYVYEPFVVDSKELHFDLDTFIPMVKEHLNTF